MRALFAMMMGGRAVRQLTPETVQRAFQIDVVELKAILRQLEADLADFQDISKLKSALRAYKAGQPADELDMELLGFLLRNTCLSHG